jgi:hypothetical protein
MEFDSLKWLWQTLLLYVVTDELGPIAVPHTERAYGIITLQLTESHIAVS